MREGLQLSAAEAAAGFVSEKLKDTLDQPADAFNVDLQFQSAVAEALKTKRSVQLAARLRTPGGEAGGLAEAYDRVQRVQGNVVDLSAWDLSQGSADSQLVIAWMTSGPSGLTRLVLDAPKEFSSGTLKLAVWDDDVQSDDDIIGAVDHHIMSCKQCLDIVILQPFGERRDIDPGIERVDRGCRLRHFWAADAGGGVKDLPVEVGQVDGFTIHDGQVADTGGRQIEDCRRAETACAYDKHAALQKPFLTLLADIGHDRLTCIAFKIFVTEHDARLRWIRNRHCRGPWSQAYRRPRVGQG